MSALGQSFEDSNRVPDNLSFEVAFPGTERWDAFADYEAVRWPELFNMTTQEHHDIYDPYNDRSVFLSVALKDKDPDKPTAISRMILPKLAKEFEYIGTLTMHDVFVGNPYWGTLDISDDGLETLNTYDPRLSTDIATHFADAPITTPWLESMEVGLTNAHAAYQIDSLKKTDPIPPEKLAAGPLVVTDLVQVYLNSMKKRYNFYPEDGSAPIIGIEELGAAQAYGEEDERYWTTLVAIPSQKLLAADKANRARNGRGPVNKPEVFMRICPEFADMYATLREAVTTT